MNAKSAPTWQTKVTDALTRDPKKTGVLTVLALVLAIVGGRTLIGDKAGPAIAPAGPMTDSPRPVDAGEAFKASGKKDSALAMRRWLSSSSKKISRNLFKVQLENYPQLTGKAVRPLNSADQDKSAQQEADELKEQEERLGILKAQAQQLKLQSTIMTAMPQAMINGELLKVGDVIAPGSADGLAGFKVVKIEPRRVIIGRDGVKLDILMK